jgi:O-antigen ligase
MTRTTLPGTFTVEAPRRLNPERWPGPLKLAAGLGVLAVLFFGLVLFPWYTLGAMLLFALGVPAMVLAWHYPEFALVGLIFLGSRLLDPRFIEIRLPVGGGIELPDIALLGLTGVSLLRNVRKGQPVLPRSWVMVPFVALSWLAVFSAALSVLLRAVEVSWALAELRGFAYYATLLLVMWNIRERAQLLRLLTGLYLIGLFIVMIMLIQQFVGPVPLFAGQDNTSWQIIGQTGGGVTRIRPPAHVLLYFISILSFVQAAYTRHPLGKAVMFGLAIFLNLALLLTFTRSQWVASGLAMGLALLAFPSQARTTLLLLAAAIALAVGGLVVAQQDEFETFLGEVNFATPLVERVESIFELGETLNSYSAQTRYFQTYAAIDSIKANPVLGVGLGNTYRGLTSEEANSRYTRFLRFIENSYLYMTTKMGLPALLIFGALAVAVVFSAWRNYRRVTDPFLQGVILACLVSFIGLVVWAFNHPLFMLPEYTIMVGAIIGISEAAGLIERGDVSHESPV